jgi:hypothetical protein
MSIQTRLGRLEKRASPKIHMMGLVCELYDMTDQEVCDAYNDLLESDPERMHQIAVGGTTPERRAFIKETRDLWDEVLNSEWFKSKYPNAA